MAIAFVNFGGNSSTATGLTLAVTPSVAPVAGHTLVVVACVVGAESTATCADNATGGSSTYIRQVSKSNGTFTTYVFTCLSVKSGTTIITVTFATTGAERCAKTLEYSGVLSIGVTNSSSGTGTTLTLATTTQDANNFIVGGFATHVQATMTISAGTQRGTTQFTTNTTLQSADNTAASPGSVNVGFTDNVSGSWAIVETELRSVAAASSKGYGNYLPLFGRG